MRLNNLLAALEAEQKMEESFYKEISLSKSFSERIQSGILWYPLNVDKAYFTLGENVEIEVTPRSLKSGIEEHSFKVGMSANFFINNTEKDEFRGTISFARKNRIRIIVNDERLVKDEILNANNCGIEPVYNDRPYRVMRDALNNVRNSREIHIESLREGIDRKSLPQHVLPENRRLLDIGYLNVSQKEAVQGCLDAELMGIIHGPPGTGKTTTLVTLIKNLVHYEQRILVCTPSNNAVDLMVRRLHEEDLSVLRIGNVTRIGNDIGHLCLDERVRRHKEWQHIKQVKIEAESARKEANRYKRKFGPQQKKDRNALFREARELRKWARELEERLVDSVIRSAQVICTTLIGSATHNLEGLTFDTVVIDEASQALEAECWVAMLKGRRFILAGDHKQLPPTVKSSEAIKLKFDETILDRMTDHIDATFLLNTQYCMNNTILSFSNQQFYKGSLCSADSVANQRLSQDEEPLVFIDTSGCGFEEKQNPKTRSYYNVEEYYIIREHLLLNKDALQSDISIGLISPYAGQVAAIKEESQKDDMMRSMNIEVNSIDGFQGQEKDVIYVTLVRSNPEGNIGFLKDYRRLNVALTRARFKLVIVGDMSTLGGDSVYLTLSEHVEEVGVYKSAWEYMR